MARLRTILCPTDFSACSREAFRLAATLARAKGARLVVLYVNSSLGPMVAFQGALERLQPPEYGAKLRCLLRDFRVPDARVNVEHRLAEGDPVEVILRVAEET